MPRNPIIGEQQEGSGNYRALIAETNLQSNWHGRCDTSVTENMLEVSVMLPDGETANNLRTITDILDDIICGYSHLETHGSVVQNIQHEPVGIQHRIYSF